MEVFILVWPLYVSPVFSKLYYSYVNLIFLFHRAAAILLVSRQNVHQAVALHEDNQLATLKILLPLHGGKMEKFTVMLNFSILMHGWRSDRGRIYIIYGKPLMNVRSKWWQEHKEVQQRK